MRKTGNVILWFFLLGFSIDYLFAQSTDENVHAQRHEFVKRGNHAEELKLGDYVVVGVFQGKGNAKSMARELKKLSYANAAYGYLTNKNLWYVHLGTAADIETARNDRDKIKKMKMFKEAWLLTVQE